MTASAGTPCAAPTSRDALHTPGFPLVVPLRSRRRRRVEAARSLQNILPGGGLLAAGAKGLAGGATGTALALAVTEVVTSVLLLATMVRSVKQLRRDRRAESAPTPDAQAVDVTSHAAHLTSHADGGASHADGGTSHAGNETSHAGSVNWEDIWAAAVLLAEAWQRWHDSHHVARPTLVLAAIALVLGLSHGSVARRAVRRRALTLTDEQLSVGKRGLRRFVVPWSQLADISLTDSHACLRAASGAERRIDLDDLDNKAEVVAALVTARKHLAAQRKSPTSVGAGADTA